MKTAEQLFQELNQSWVEYKNTNDTRIKQIEEHGSATSDNVEKLLRLEASIDELMDVKERLEKMEVKLDRPDIAANDEIKQLRAKHWDDFESWIRKPFSKDNDVELQRTEADAIAKKAVTIGTTTAGGHAVPEQLDRRIAAKVLEISDLRNICTVVQVGSSDYKKLVDELGAASGWAGEDTTRSETGTPTLQEVAPPMGELYAVPKASEWSLDDMFFNVEDWLVNSVAKEFAYQEGVAFVTGNGTNKPKGILGGTPESSGDSASPRRTFGELMYLPSGAAATIPHSPAAATASPLPVYGGDLLIDVVYSLKKAYRDNARWTMNKATLQTVRKWKDIDGQYYWQPSFQLGEPDRILGYATSELEAMPDIAANAFPIAFGDFKEGYYIVERVGTRMTVDPYTSRGHVLFYIRKRVGGSIINDEAIRVVKIATS